jgi:lipopolysaccharide transport system ATP-binding protein
MSSMRHTAIRVENLGKQYYIGNRLERYRTLRDTIAQTFWGSVQRVSKLLNGQIASVTGGDRTIWALRGVSFEIEQGEAVGIIGRNGAGKSTLLKILSRITEPTEGYADIQGRVGSLLEVGTGFHQELTGRENIYLNGAILGMKHREIDRRFDAIVSFAEVEQFVDTPIKHYSSGMRLRLGFSVAAHLEPEILLVDEVLATGDVYFQRKCLNRMEDLGQQGRTILFVSHNLPTITRLCNRAMLLDEGKLIESGPAPRIVNTYLNSGSGTMAECIWDDMRRAPGNNIVRLHAVRVRSRDGRVADVVDIREPIGLEMEYQVLQSDQLLMPFFYVSNQEGTRLFSSVDRDADWQGRRRPIGQYTSTAWIPGNLFAEGMVYVGAVIRSPQLRLRHFHGRDIVAFQVIDSLDGDSARSDYTGPMLGVMRPMLEWSTQHSPDGNAFGESGLHTFAVESV